MRFKGGTNVFGLTFGLTGFWPLKESVLASNLRFSSPGFVLGFSGLRPPGLGPYPFLLGFVSVGPSESAGDSQHAPIISYSNKFIKQTMNITKYL